MYLKNETWLDSNENLTIDSWNISLTCTIQKRISNEMGIKTKVPIFLLSSAMTTYCNSNDIVFSGYDVCFCFCLSTQYFSVNGDRK